MIIESCGDCKYLNDTNSKAVCEHPETNGKEIERDEAGEAGIIIPVWCKLPIGEV